jgi:hypothetical protein
MLIPFFLLCSDVGVERAIRTLDLVYKHVYRNYDYDSQNTTGFGGKHKSALIKTVLGAHCPLHNTKLLGFKYMLREELGFLSIDWGRDVDKITDLMNKAHPFFQSGGDTYWKELATMFVVDRKGFASFEKYVRGLDEVSQFPSAKDLLCVLEAVIYVRSTSKATEKRTKVYMDQAESIWTAVKKHIDSNYFAFDEAEQINKVCFALLKVNPDLKECEDYLTSKMTQAQAPVTVTPSNKARNAADFFAAIESAQSRVKSLTRTKSSLAKIVEQNGEIYDELNGRAQKSALAASTSQAAFLDAETEVRTATQFLARAEEANVEMSIVYAKKRLTAAKELESALKKPYENDKLACNEATANLEKASETLDEAKSELDLITQELEEANAYLEELYEKNEVIDVDADDTPAQEPARKKQRLPTPRNL